MNNTERRYAFTSALLDVDAAMTRARNLAKQLPKLPKAMTGHVWEPGYTRVEGTLQNEGEGWFCPTRGYDAYGEGGEFEFVMGDDGLAYAMPEDVSWD